MKNLTPPPSPFIPASRLRSALAASLALLAACAAHGQSPYSTAVQSLNPIGYWPLQETVQPPAANIEVNNGSLGAIANMYYSTNSLTQIPSIAGPMGNAARQFTASSSAYALVPTTDNRVSLPPGGPFTVEIWAEPRTYGQFGCVASQSGPIPAGGNNAANYKAGWMLGQNYYPAEDDGSGTYSGALYGWSFTVFNGQTIFSGANCIAPYEYLTNFWYHLVGVYDGTNCTLYINGVQANSALESSPMPAGTAFLPDTWDPIEVGCSRGIGANSYNGGISEFSIYTYALTAAQVANHFNQSTLGYSQWQAAVTGDNPAMYYQMSASSYFPPDPGSLPTAANLGTAASITTNLIVLTADGYVQNNGIYQAGTLPGVAGPSYAGFGSPSYACAFQALGGAVVAGYTPAMDPTGTNSPETVIAWFQGNPCDDNGRWNTIASHSDSSWRAKINNGNSVWDAGGGQDLTGPGFNSSGMNLNDGGWHMFAGVFNPVNSNNTVYIDATEFVNFVTNRSIAGKSNLDVFIGGAPDHIGTAGGAQQYMAGSIAHVAYFNTALTAAQIQSLYSAAEVPPRIIVQPASFATTQSGGSSATFTVTASAASTGLTYQWYFNNGSGPVAVPGANGTNLVLSPLADNQSGTYYVVINNSYGAVTSAVAGLNVSSEPLILSQIPGASLQLFAGQNYTLSVNAVGSNVTYQWYTNGTADTTAGTTSAYALSGVTTSMSGYTYKCTVANTLGSANSQTTTLTVVSLPAAVTAGGSFGSNVLALGPTGYWPMHEVAAGVAGDVENNLGTLGAIGDAEYADWDQSNAVGLVEMIRQEAGPMSGGVATFFKRSPCSFMTVNHATLATTITAPFSVETWANPADLTGNPTVIIGQGGGSTFNGTGGDGGFALQWGNSNSKSNCFSFALWNGNGGANDELATASVYPEGQWYHLVATYDGTNIVFYVNGQPITTFQAGTNVASMNPDFWSPLVIGGGRWAGGGPGNPYQGLIAEPAIYTNVLSAATVSKHYSDGLNLGATTYANDVVAGKPLLYYRLTAPPYVPPSRSTWPVVYNYGSFATNGVYLPGVSPGNISNLGLGNVGSTVSTGFNGDGGFADLGMGAPLNPLGYTSFSYMAFFKGYPSDDRSFQSIMTANDATWRSSINSSGKIQAHGIGADITSSNVYNDGNWHMMVVTCQGTSVPNTTNLLYIDGVLQATNNTASTNNPAADPGPEALIGNENGFWIMRSGATGNQGEERCLAGSVCEAAFFNGTVLSPAQITTLYNAAGVAPSFPYTAGIAPSFISEPIVTNVNEGAVFNYTFGPANGSGAAAITYQWYSNNVAMAGQTTSTLSLNPVVPTSGANYYEVATSPYGSATSQILKVSVNLKPLIVSAAPPSSPVEILATSTLNLSVVASGAAPLKYVWSINNVLDGAVTNTSLAVSNISTANSGTYQVIVSNSLGTATNIWVVDVLSVSGGFVPAVIALNPIGLWLMNEPGDGITASNSGVCHDYIAGNNGVYENAITGAPGFNWADTFTGFYDTNTSASFGPQQNSCALNISNILVSSPSNGEFTVQCWCQAPAPISSSINTPGLVGKGLYNHEEFALDLGNHVGSSTAYRFETRISSEATINANSTVVAGSDTNWHFVVGVCDQANSNVTVYIDGTNAGSAPITPGAGIDNASDSVPVMIGSRTSGSPYSVTGMNEQFTGNIADVAIFNYALTPSQIAAEFLAAGIAPIITVQPPASNIISANGPIKLTAAAEGSGTLFYQWIDVNSNNVVGQTNPVLSIASLPTNNTFALFVSNAFGTAYSSQSVVTVIQGAPEIQDDITPTNAAALAEGNMTFSASFVGTQPITYGWTLNGNPVVNNARISGANSNVLTISDVQFSDAGSYQLLATNSFGTSNSSVATFNVFSNLNFNNTGVGWESQFYSTGGWQGSNIVQLTGATGSEDAAIFFDSPVYIGAFEASFTYIVPTGPGGADGATFCIQNDPRGAAAIGGAGGSLGVSTGNVPNQTFGGSITPSFEFEYNIYAANAFGGVGVSFDTDGTVGPEVVPGSIVINSGDPIATVIDYANGVATVYLTDTFTSATYSASTNINIPGHLGTDFAYVGFTAADGGSKSTQIVSDFQFVAFAALTAQVSNGNLVLSWPSSMGDYILQTTPTLSPANWTAVTAQQSEVNNYLQVSVPITGKAAYYRLVLQVPSL